MSNGRSPIPVLLLIALVGGGILAYKLWRPTPVLPTVASAQQSQRDVDVDVYVDGTGSIKNFLVGSAKASENNYLHNFLNKCEGALRYPGMEPGWGKGTVYLWRFTSQLDPLQYGDLAEMTKHSDDPKNFSGPKTSIDVAAKDDPQKRRNTQNSEVKVIVTDLYQSDSVNDRISSPLAERYLKSGDGAVAILGVRNPYAKTGAVDDLRDVNGGSVKLPAGSADSMPFYVIIAGDHAADVRIAREALLAKADLREAARTTQVLSAYFSRNSDAVEQLSRDFNWERAQGKAEVHDGTFTQAPDSAQGQSMDFHWDRLPGAKPNDTGSVDVASIGSIPMLSWRKGILTVHWSVKSGNGIGRRAEPDPELAAVSSRLKVLPTVEIANKIPKWAVKKGSGDSKTGDVKQEVSPEAAGALTDFQYDAEEQSISANIDRSKLVDRGRIYLIQLEVIAQYQSSAFAPDQPLMKEWNLEDRELPNPNVFGSASGSRPGRTPNLSKFLTNLQGQMFNGGSDPVRTATYYLYVKAR